MYETWFSFKVSWAEDGKEISHFLFFGAGHRFADGNMIQRSGGSLFFVFGAGHRFADHSIIQRSGESHLLFLAVDIVLLMAV